MNQVGFYEMRRDSYKFGYLVVDDQSRINGPFYISLLEHEDVYISQKEVKEGQQIIGFEMDQVFKSISIILAPRAGEGYNNHSISSVESAESIDCN